MWQIIKMLLLLDCLKCDQKLLIDSGPPREYDGMICVDDAGRRYRCCSNLFHSFQAYNYFQESLALYN